MKITRIPNPLFCALVVLAVTMVPGAAWAQKDAPASGDDSEELAKKLQNPVANLISVPLQSNWDFGIGSTNAMRYTLNVQPVIPLSLNQEWNLITRTIVPIIHAESPVAGGGTRSGLGDITQSFFLSPQAPIHGWIVGAGPVFVYPSATDKALGAEKWGAGPTAVRYEFASDGPGMGKGGIGTILVNGQKVAEGRIEHTQCCAFSADETADVGQDDTTPVTEDYKEGDNKFTGQIHKVTIELKEMKAAHAEAEKDVLHEAHARKQLAD